MAEAPDDKAIPPLIAAKVIKFLISLKLLEE
jgi:hypothetical protein